MKEILLGIFHWTTFHEEIEQDVHSYGVSATGPMILIDPRVPAAGMTAFDAKHRPEHIYLTNRLHYRHSAKFLEAFATKIWCHSAGLHEFSMHPKVHGFEHGQELPGKILALEVGSLCPEETAFFIPANGGILSIGDAIIRVQGALQFVPDAFMGYVADPHGTRVTCTYSGDLLTYLAHSAGPYLDLAYNGSRLGSVIDSLGRQTVFTYDGSGEHLQTARDYRGMTTRYEYDLSGLTSAAQGSLAAGCAPPRRCALLLDPPADQPRTALKDSRGEDRSALNGKRA